MLHPSSIFTAYLENLTNISDKKSFTNQCSLINLTICLTNIDNQINDFYLIIDLEILEFIVTSERRSLIQNLLQLRTRNVRQKLRKRHFIAQDQTGCIYTLHVK